MNHRFLLRLVTNLSVILLTLACFGIVLWVIDEFLRWDILPDAWSLLVQAFLVSGGIIAFVLVVMNVLLSLSLLAESNASRANLPDYVVSMRSRRRIQRGTVAGLAAIALLIAGLQITNHFRAQIADREQQAETARLKAENKAAFDQTKTELDNSVEPILALFTPPLLEAIETNTLAEKGQIGNFSKLANSIQSSFPHAPVISVITPAVQPPFKYARLTKTAIKSNEGTLSLQPELFATFPTEQETQMVEQLLAGQLPEVSDPLDGQIFSNTVPSSWGVLNRNGKVIAVVYLQPDDAAPINYVPSYIEATFQHTGPDSLLTN